MVSNSRVLVFGCAHIPYEHPDMLAFLSDIKKKYRPDKVINLGDMEDHHGISYHEQNPDLRSAGDELVVIKKKLQPLFELFSNMDIMDSNHGSLVFRKAFSAGLPRGYIMSMRDVYKAPKGWAWHSDLTIKLSNGQKLYCCHQMNEDVRKAIMLRGVCVAQAHHHSTADIRYVSNPDQLLWGMTTGCLIDRKAMAFAYNKLQLKRPIISVGFIENGRPTIIPMNLNSKGHWTGKL